MVWIIILPSQDLFNKFVIFIMKIYLIILHWFSVKLLLCYTYRVERGAGWDREWPRKWSAEVALGTSVLAAVGCSDLEGDGLAVRSYSTDLPSGCSHVCALLLSAYLRDKNKCQNIIELLSRLQSICLSNCKASPCMSRSDTFYGSLCLIKG